MMLKFHQASTVLLLALHSPLAELISQVIDKIPEVDPEGLCSQVKTKFKSKSSSCILMGHSTGPLSACQCVVAFLNTLSTWPSGHPTNCTVGGKLVGQGGIRTGRVSPILAMAGILVDATIVIWSKSALLPNVL